MNMKTTKLCRECGTPLASGNLLDLCPKCMMKAGLTPPAQGTIPVAPDAFVDPPETETREFAAGTRLGYCGDYELLEEIARGGMGVVYKARQSSLKRIVAVKTIRTGELADEAEVRRFHTEAQAAARLQHPNIVAIHEIGEDRGRHYFSMDFVEGRNLAQIAGGRPVPARSAAEWLKVIAGAVQFAHEHGVLHRDLKPQNIMVDSAGRPHVTDFGLARSLTGDSTLTQTGAVMGSPSYMSPEQARGRNDLVGPANDVYSLGAILYELLTGRPPFCGKTPVETLSEVVNDEPLPPRLLNADAPIDLESICLKCLEKNPLLRYPTAREMELDLGRFLAGEPVQARPAGALRRTMCWFRRHRWVSSAAVSALILTLSGLAYGLWEQTRLLVWTNAHPGVTKAPAPQSYDINWIFSPVMVVILTCSPMFVFLVHKLKARPTGTKIFALPNPRAPVMLAARAAFNLFATVYALFLVALEIHAFVWEGEQPSWIIGIVVLLLAWSGVSGLMRVVRQQMRIPVEPFPEYKASPEFHAALGWIFLCLVILFAGLWMLSVPQPFSRANLFPLGLGLAVVLSIRFALFLLVRGWPGMFASEFSGSAPVHRAFPGMSGWIKLPVRLAIVSLSLGILLIDFVILLAVFLTPDSHSSFPHDQGIFICGLIFGGLLILLIYLARKKPTSATPRPRDISAPEPLPPEQLASVHAAIFAGRTDDAFNLYHAANGAKPNRKVIDMFNLRKMEAQLKLTHREKFAAGVLDRADRNVNRWAWLWRITIMAAGLALLLLPRGSFGPLIGLLYGLGIGAFIRAMSSNRMSGWKTAYRQMRPAIRFLAWILVACFAFSLAAVCYSLIVRPHMVFGLCVGGLVAGWLLVHLSLRKRKAS
jgi:tRNA A-37 threonylcarbamoyl transferase component Bud32